MVLTVPPACLLAVFGTEIITFLFPERFHGAGWMVQILGAGAAASAISSTIGPVLLAIGDSYRYMILQATRAGILVIGMWIGHVYGGFTGILIAIAISDLVNYPVLALCVRRYGAWLPALDLAGFFAAAGTIILGWYLFL